uniref:Glycoprotein n=1 Tax=Solenopsis invicta virus 14 TaxID=2810810 RepID=A0A891H5I6_9VIRU|nr:glycoprotein [Solenopsis invicta virus 14]
MALMYLSIILSILLAINSVISSSFIKVNVIDIRHNYAGVYLPLALSVTSETEYYRNSTNEARIILDDNFWKQDLIYDTNIYYNLVVFKNETLRLHLDVGPHYSITNKDEISIIVLHLKLISKYKNIDNCQITSTDNVNFILCDKVSCSNITNHENSTLNLYDNHSDKVYTIDHKVLRCHLILKCSFIDSLLIPNCYTVLGLLIINMFFYICILLSCCFIYSTYIIISRTIHKEIVIKKENSRIKIDKYKRSRIVNGRAPNKTRRIKENKYLFHSLVIFCVCFKFGDCCDITIDSSIMIHINNDTYSKTTMTLNNNWPMACFQDQNVTTQYVRLVNEKHVCSYVTDYYTPRYSVQTIEDWRCSGAGYCEDGIFSTSKLNKTKIYFDFKRKPSPFDGCFYASDECVRINYEFSRLNSPCATVHCSSINTILVVEVSIQTSQGLKHSVVQLHNDEYLDFHGIKILARNVEHTGLTNKLLKCEEKIYTKHVNNLGIYNGKLFGLLQCESYSDANNLNLNKCHTDPSEYVKIIDGTHLFRNPDKITLFDDLHLGHKITDDIGDVLSIQIPDFYQIDILKPSVNIEKGVLLNSNGFITDIYIDGVADGFETARITYKCNITKTSFGLECFLNEPIHLPCFQKEVQFNITISAKYINLNRECTLNTAMGLNSHVKVHTNLKHLTIDLPTQRYDIISKTYPTDSIWPNFSFKALFLSYFFENSYFLIPLILIIIIIIIFKIINALK